MKTFLKVPFAEKDQAKSQGARFDMASKQWYCPDGIDLFLFKRWLLIDQQEAFDKVGAPHGR